MDSLSRAFSGPTSELLLEYFTTLNHLYARLHTLPDHHRLHHLTLWHTVPRMVASLYIVFPGVCVPISHEEEDHCHHGSRLERVEW
jgi:hypothetical protein